MDEVRSDGYEQDFYAWAMKNAQYIRDGKLAAADVEHIAEELESMGKSERRALESYVRNVLLHLLKWQHQPGLRGVSWKQSIRNGRIAIEKILRDSPSLKTRVAEIIESEYPLARTDAIDETGLAETFFPAVCSFSELQILDRDFWPD